MGSAFLEIVGLSYGEVVTALNRDSAAVNMVLMCLPEDLAFQRKLVRTDEDSQYRKG